MIPALSYAGLFDFAIIDTEEFIRSGYHVDMIRLSLEPLFIQKRYTGSIFRGILQQSCHNLE